jgi:molybdopterin converting factor small subunit
MAIKINIFYPTVQQCLDNRDSVEVDGSTVGECLDDLVRQFPAVGKWIFDERHQLLKPVFVYVNAESTYKVDLARPVKSKDELILAVLVTGG